MHAQRAFRGGVAAAAVGLFAAAQVEAIAPAGESCAFLPANTINFTDGDSTSGRSDNYDPVAAETCPATGFSLETGQGGDVVYRITPAKSGTVTVFLDSTTDNDLGVYVVSPTCTEGMFAANCIIGDDSGGGGTPEDVTFAVTAGTDYFVVVDGFSGQSGPFNISVTGLLSPLDIDGDGEVTPLTDGLLVLRWEFGFVGATLVTGAVDLVNCTRCSSVAIQSYLTTLRAAL